MAMLAGRISEVLKSDEATDDGGRVGSGGAKDVGARGIGSFSVGAPPPPPTFISGNRVLRLKFIYEVPPGGGLLAELRRTCCC